MFIKRARFLLGFAMVISMLFSGCSNNSMNTSSEKNEYETPSSTTYEISDLPPYVKYNDKLYKYSKEYADIENLKSEDFLGEITEGIDLSKMPTENLTSNFAAKGSKIYYYSEDAIVVVQYSIYDGNGELVEKEPFACICSLE